VVYKERYILINFSSSSSRGCGFVENLRIVLNLKENSGIVHVENHVNNVYIKCGY